MTGKSKTMFAHHESVICYVSTEHCTRIASNSWRANIGGNTLFANKSTRLTPVQISIPNVFPNIKVDLSMSTTSGTTTLPAGQYTSAQIMDFFNTSAIFGVADELQMTQNDQGRYIITNNSLAAKFVNFTVESQKFLGSPALGFGMASFASVFFTKLPNLGGEKLVFVKSNRLAALNMVSAEAGGLHDILFSVPLTDTNYGDTALYAPGDSILGDIDFQAEIDMSKLDFEILDSLMAPLAFDDNQHIRMVWKLHHNEGDASGGGGSR